jgi:hypothetical protein
MNDEDKKLKEIFKRGMDGLNEGTPDFQLMMDQVVVKPGKKNWVSLKIAASVLVLISAAIFLVIKNQDRKPESYLLLTKWNEPTRGLMPISSPGSSTTISTWSAPTDFLLSNNSRQIKN